MYGFKIKVLISKILDTLGILDAKLRKINNTYKNNYIRVVNYHDILKEDSANFEEQLIWYGNHFHNVNYSIFKEFMAGNYKFRDKPGIMITFDDGYCGNYENAFPLLEKYHFTGYFFVSSDLVGTKKYMNQEQLKKMMSLGHIVGCHTATHHRMNINDTTDVLMYEIYESKKKLENTLKDEIDIFCWCGGEENTYTREAAEIIKKARYKYSFMTNSYPVIAKSNLFQLERINCEASWGKAVIKFQICGFMDNRLKNKRKRVESLTKL